MKTIKLSGDFTWGNTLHELFTKMEDAKSELDAITNSVGYGSETYYEALNHLKAAKAEHAAHLKSRLKL